MENFDPIDLSYIESPHNRHWIREKFNQDCRILGLSLYKDIPTYTSTIQSQDAIYLENYVLMQLHEIMFTSSMQYAINPDIDDTSEEILYLNRNFLHIEGGKWTQTNELLYSEWVLRGLLFSAPISYIEDVDDKIRRYKHRVWGTFLGLNYASRRYGYPAALGNSIILNMDINNIRSKISSQYARYIAFDGDMKYINSAIGSKKFLDSIDVNIRSIILPIYIESHFYIFAYMRIHDYEGWDGFVFESYYPDGIDYKDQINRHTKLFEYKVLDKDIKITRIKDIKCIAQQGDWECSNLAFTTVMILCRYFTVYASYDKTNFAKFASNYNNVYEINALIKSSEMERVTTWRITSTYNTLRIKSSEIENVPSRELIDLTDTPSQDIKGKGKSEENPEQEETPGGSGKKENIESKQTVELISLKNSARTLTVLNYALILINENKYIINDQLYDDLILRPTIQSFRNILNDIKLQVDKIMVGIGYYLNGYSPYKHKLLVSNESLFLNRLKQNSKMFMTIDPVVAINNLINNTDKREVPTQYKYNGKYKFPSIILLTELQYDEIIRSNSRPKGVLLLKLDLNQILYVAVVSQDLNSLVFGLLCYKYLKVILNRNVYGSNINNDLALQLFLARMTWILYGDVKTCIIQTLRSKNTGSGIISHLTYGKLKTNNMALNFYSWPYLKKIDPLSDLAIWF